MSRSTLLWTTRTAANRTAPRLEVVRCFRLNSWLTYLIAIPLIIAITLLAIFFFAAFLGLFAARSLRRFACGGSAPRLHD